MSRRCGLRVPTLICKYTGQAFALFLRYIWDSGGGNTENIALDRFGPSLRWMLSQAIAHELLVRPYQGGWSDPEPIDSMTWFWRILEILPLKRLSYDAAESDTTLWWYVLRWNATTKLVVIEIFYFRPHAAASRQIQKHQLIHESAVAYLRKESTEQAKTRPIARIRHNGSWTPLTTILFEFQSKKELIENDSQWQTVTAILDALSSTNPIADAIGTGLTGLMKDGSWDYQIHIHTRHV